MSTKKQQKPAEVSRAIVAPPIRVALEYESTEHEGGREGGTFGDVAIEATVEGSRLALAERLRELASTIANTHGDPIRGATVIVLMRRPMTPKDWG